MGWTETRGVFGDPQIKAEGSSVTDSWTYKARSRYNDAMTPYGVLNKKLDRIEYILQRTVTDYDELVNQFNALKDIEESNHG